MGGPRLGRTGPRGGPRARGVEGSRAGRGAAPRGVTDDGPRRPDAALEDLGKPAGGRREPSEAGTGRPGRPRKGRAVGGRRDGGGPGGARMEDGTALEPRGPAGPRAPEVTAAPGPTSFTVVYQGGALRLAPAPPPSSGSLGPPPSSSAPPAFWARLSGAPRPRVPDGGWPTAKRSRGLGGAREAPSVGGPAGLQPCEATFTGPPNRPTRRHSPQSKHPKRLNPHVRGSGGIGPTLRGGEGRTWVL